LRFDVIQDRDDMNRFYFYEVYRDEAALEAHRQTPHFKLYAEKVQPWLVAAPERRFGKNLVPSDDNWR
jgi:(4S)-4-hydroxy-5-phosphonooxypentane-2,3-dione isomerase